MKPYNHNTAQKQQMENPMTNNAQYITIEGIEGCGKTSYLKELAKKRKEITVILDEDPLSTFGITLMQTITQKDIFFRSTDPMREFLAFSMIDVDQIKNKVLPAVEKKQTVVQDRGAETTCLYAAMQISEKEGISLKEAYDKLFVLRQELGAISSGVILILDDIDVCIQRAEERNGRKYTEDERQFLKKIEKGLRSVAQWYPERIIAIDCTKKSIEEASKMIEEIILGN